MKRHDRVVATQDHGHFIKAGDKGDVLNVETGWPNEPRAAVCWGVFEDYSHAHLWIPLSKLEVIEDE